MIEVAEVIKLIGNTNSSNDKLYLLKKNEHVPGLKEILRFIYNPYIRTGISKAKLAKAMKMNIDKGSVRVLWSEAISYFNVSSAMTFTICILFSENFTRTLCIIILYEFTRAISIIFFYRFCYFFINSNIWIFCYF